MLEIKILKELHEGREEARKLRSYIEQCDVYGVESGFTTYAEAKSLEHEWNDDLHLSRSRFADIRRKVYGNQSSEIIEYGLARDDLLFRNQRPLYVTERHSPEDATLLIADLQTATRAQIHSEGALAHGDVDAFLLLAGLGCEGVWKNTVARDNNIALNLSSAERHLRELHPQLNSKDTIRLTIGLGAMHFPEDYLSFSVPTIRLFEPVSSDPSTFYYNAYNSWRESSKISERDILAYGISLLQKNRKMHMNVSSDELHNLSFEELVGRIS